MVEGSKRTLSDELIKKYDMFQKDQKPDDVFQLFDKINAGNSLEEIYEQYEMEQ